MKTQIATTKAPGAIGPYSQAIDTGSFVFISGQIPVNPETGEIPEGISAQTAQSLAKFRSHERSICGSFHRAFPSPFGSGSA